MGTLCERCPWGRRTRSVDSERVSWCISPSIKCASSGSRFWTMDNPSAQLQHMAMCVLDALYTKPPRVRGSDTVLCVNSGTANACTPRIVVRQGTSKLLCRAKHGILRQTLVQCAVQNWHEQRRSKTATSCLQVGNGWGCDPEARHGQCVRQLGPHNILVANRCPTDLNSLLGSLQLWVSSRNRLPAVHCLWCGVLCGVWVFYFLINGRSQLLKLFHSAGEDACFVPQLGLAVVHADLGVSPQFDPHQPWIAATRASWQETYKSSKNANKRSPALNSPVITLSPRCIRDFLWDFSLGECVGK